jgi:hypothetical protein
LLHADAWSQLISAGRAGPEDGENRNSDNERCHQLQRCIKIALELTFVLCWFRGLRRAVLLCIACFGDVLHSSVHGRQRKSRSGCLCGSIIFCVVRLLLRFQVLNGLISVFVENLAHIEGLQKAEQRLEMESERELLYDSAPQYPPLVSAQSINAAETLYPGDPVDSLSHR